MYKRQQIYIQILYAAESVKVNENTLQVSIAQRDRGQELPVSYTHLDVYKRQ